MIIVSAVFFSLSFLNYSFYVQINVPVYPNANDWPLSLPVDITHIFLWSILLPQDWVCAKCICLLGLCDWLFVPAAVWHPCQWPDHCCCHNGNCHIHTLYVLYVSTLNVNTPAVSQKIYTYSFKWSALTQLRVFWIYHGWNNDSWFVGVVQWSSSRNLISQNKFLAILHSFLFLITKLYIKHLKRNAKSSWPVGE